MPNVSTVEFTTTTPEATSSAVAPSFPEQILRLTNLTHTQLESYGITSYEIDGESYFKEADVIRVIAYEEKDRNLFHKQMDYGRDKVHAVNKALFEKCKRYKEKIERLKDEVEELSYFQQVHENQIEALEYEIEGLHNFINKYSKVCNFSTNNI